MGALKNKKILITRDKRQAYNLVRLIKNEGGFPIVFPTVAIAPPASWNEIDRAILQLKNYQWIIFSSSNAVQFFLQRLDDHSQLKQIKIAAVGNKTANVLNEQGIGVDLIPETAGAAGLLAALSDEEIKGNRFLLPASEITLATLKTEIAVRGGIADVVTAYRSVKAQNNSTDLLAAMIEYRTVDCITFFSPSAVRYFMQLLPAESLDQLKKNNILLAAIGKTTAAAIEKEGLCAGVTAPSASEEKLLAAIGERLTQASERKELVS